MRTKMLCPSVVEENNTGNQQEGLNYAGIKGVFLTPTLETQIFRMLTDD